VLRKRLLRPVPALLRPRILASPGARSSLARQVEEAARGWREVGSGRTALLSSPEAAACEPSLGRRSPAPAHLALVAGWGAGAEGWEGQGSRGERGKGRGERGQGSRGERGKGRGESGRRLAWRRTLGIWLTWRYSWEAARWGRL